MKLLVLGAAGATARPLLDAAIEGGHQVTALVRDPAKLSPAAGVTVVAGDARSAEDIEAALRGHDALISTLGAGSSAPSGLMRDASAAIVAAADRTGVRRAIVLSAFGVGDSAKKASAAARFMYRTGAKALYADKVAGEGLLKASDLEWTLAYPVLLTNGPASGRLAVIDLETLPHLGGLPRVSRADVAGFLLRAAEQVSWAHRTAVLTTSR